MADHADDPTSTAATEASPLGARWRAMGRARQDALQLEVARRRARARLFEDPPAAVAVGRYLVLGRIGHGSMGVVYAAYDPQLDRKIALKVLYADSSGGTHDRHRRLLREAQALAQLTHPNVVAIHDVGSFEPPRTDGAADDAGASVFLAMEHIEGETLTRWLARPRSWQEILDTMLQAARGISAAHAKGLVHRDFKPDNVMVGADGRVRVMDFGLARTTIPISDSALSTRPSALALEVTTASTLVGTPAYMAPEQHAGRGADALSDQFSFCVSTWEAICGERPFAGDSLPALAAAVTQGRLREWPRSARTPPWLRRALERGLAPEPQARWPSMDALVSALELVRTRAQRRRLAIVVSGCAAAALLALAGRALVQIQRERECDAAATAANPWNDERRSQIEDAIVATGLGYAPATAALVIPRLESFASAWTGAWASACRARQVEQRWGADTHERSLWCLEERRLDLDALAGELAAADATAVRAAVAAAANLPSVDPCIDEPLLARLPAPPREHDARVGAAREALARAGAATASGRAPQGLARATDALAQAQALASPRLVASAGLALGLALEQSGKYPESAAALRDAYFVAGGAKEIDLAESSATALARVLGTDLDAFDDAQTWIRLAEVEDSRMGDPEGLRDAARLTTLGSILSRAGEHEAARADHEHAVAIVERVLGEAHPELARALQGLATTEIALGRYDAALALQHRGHAVLAAALGPDHPDVAFVEINLATSELALGRYADADARYTRAATSIEAALGTEHPSLVSVFTNLATARRSMGRLGEARALLARALAIAESAYGTEHARTAAVINNLAVLEELDRRWTEALRLHERALAIRQRVLPAGHADIARSLANVALAREETGDAVGARAAYEQAIPALEAALGPDHNDLAQVMSNLAILLSHQGEHDRAIELHRRALAIWERALGPEHPDVALALTALGKALRAAGQASAAVEPLRRAQGIRERPPVDAVALAETRFALGEALWDSAGDRDDALALAREALAAYEAAVQRDVAGEIAGWIAARERL